MRALCVQRVPALVHTHYQRLFFKVILYQSESSRLYNVDSDGMHTKTAFICNRLNNLSLKIF